MTHRHNTTLDTHTVATLRAYGGGNLSQGIRRAAELVRQREEATIRPGAVVCMATALERVANLNEDAGEIGDGMLRTIVADARAALVAYYGENAND